jgi:hypothetical protein
MVDVREASSLFRRHVQRAPDDHSLERDPRTRIPAFELRNTEVQDLRLNLARRAREEDISRLDVAVHDPRVVRCRKAIDDRQQKPYGLRGGHRPVELERGREARPLEQLHRDERIAGSRYSTIEHANDRAMVELGHEPRFALQTIRDFMVQGVEMGQLEGDQCVQIQISRDPNAAHPSLIE